MKIIQNPERASRQSQRIFFSCDPRNADHKNGIISDILSATVEMERVVSWLEKPGENIDEELLRNELQGAQVLVLWVTVELLESLAEGKTDRKWPKEYTIARELNLPIIPIANDNGLFSRFSELSGGLHAIAMSDSEYLETLKAQLEKVLVTKEIQKEIHEKAFTASIFFSYRKMDVIAARKFMKQFHDLKEFEAVSIWYDFFLTAGRANN